MCQLIMASPDACASCPLAESEPDEPPSKFAQYLVHLEGLMAVGAQVAFESQPMEVWNGLKLLKIKRDEKFRKDLPKK